MTAYDSFETFELQSLLREKLEQHDPRLKYRLLDHLERLPDGGREAPLGFLTLVVRAVGWANPDVVKGLEKAAWQLLAERIPAQLQELVAACPSDLSTLAMETGCSVERVRAIVSGDEHASAEELVELLAALDIAPSRFFRELERWRLPEGRSALERMAEWKALEGTQGLPYRLPRPPEPTDAESRWRELSWKLRLLVSRQDAKIPALAAKMDCSSDHVRAILQGDEDPTLSELQVLLEALGTTMERLFEEDEKARTARRNHPVGLWSSRFLFIDPNG